MDYKEKKIKKLLKVDQRVYHLFRIYFPIYSKYGDINDLLFLLRWCQINNRPINLDGGSIIAYNQPQYLRFSEFCSNNLASSIPRR